MNKNYLTSGEFAELCNTTKVTLRHYKDIGILTPKYEGANGYFYYDAEQFYDYYAIAIFKKTGTPLSTIHTFVNHQNVPSILKILKNQQIQLTEQRKKLDEMEFIVKNSIENMIIGLSGKLNQLIPQIMYFEKEHLLAIPHDEFEIAKEDTTDEDKILISIIRKYKTLCQHCKVQTDYQLGAIIPFNKISLGKSGISHIYTKVNTVYLYPHYREKSSGNYLCLLHKGDFDSTRAYQKLILYIQENNIKVISDVYAYDLAGFMMNGIEENAMTLISVQLSCC